MSSLTDRTIDPRDHLAYAPKWARDPVEQQNTVQERSVCEPAVESISAEVSSADIVVTERRPPPPSFDPLPVWSSRPFSRFPMGIDRGRSDRCAIDVGKTTAVARGGE